MRKHIGSTACSNPSTSHACATGSETEHGVVLILSILPVPNLYSIMFQIKSVSVARPFLWCTHVALKHTPTKRNTKAQQSILFLLLNAVQFVQTPFGSNIWKLYSIQSPHPVVKCMRFKRVRLPARQDVVSCLLCILNGGTYEPPHISQVLPISLCLGLGQLLNWLVRDQSKIDRRPGTAESCTSQRTVKTVCKLSDPNQPCE